jgi:ABC-type phosphate/phosphonate transport system substrate-binding protein
MIYFKNLDIVARWVGMIMVFFSIGNAQEPNKDRSEMPHAFFAFHRNMLIETDIKDFHAAIEVWVKTVGKNAGLNFESKLYEDIKPLLEDYKKGKIDVLNIEPHVYLQVEHEINAEPAYSVLIGGKNTRKYLLLVRSDSPANDIRDLKSKSLAVMKTSEIGQIYLDALFSREKLGNPENYFSNITQKTKYTQAVLAVFFRQADACIVTESVLKTMIELNPQIGKDLKIIAASPEIVQIVGFFRPGLNANIKKDLMRVVTHLQDSAVGRQVLTLFGIDGTLQASESDLDTLRTLMHESGKFLKLK